MLETNLHGGSAGSAGDTFVTEKPLKPLAAHKSDYDNEMDKFKEALEVAEAQIIFDEVADHLPQQQQCELK